MFTKNQHPTLHRKHSPSPVEKIIVIVCLALPIVGYLLTSHPAFIVVFLTGLISQSVYTTRIRNKWKGTNDDRNRSK
jgi:uncharacterized membrane protein